MSTDSQKSEPATAHTPVKALGRLVSKYDEELCKSWLEEIDTLMLFAALFSAVVTAFAVASFEWVKEPRTNPTTTLLTHISSQLERLIDPEAPTVNFPTLLASAGDDPPISLNIARRVNGLWYTSLTLALTSALICIICKQWVREYQRVSTSVNNEDFSFRQMRFRGLQAWRVPEIIISISIILIGALLCFFVGLAYFIWDLDRQVGIALITIEGITAAGFLVTTLMPGLQYFRAALCVPRLRPVPAQCAWKSPQSMLFLHLLSFLVEGCVRLRLQVANPDKLFAGRLSLRAPFWMEYDRLWLGRLDRSSLRVDSGASIDDGLVDFIPWVFRHLAFKKELLHAAILESISTSLAEHTMRRSGLTGDATIDLAGAIKEVGDRAGRLVRPNYELLLSLEAKVFTGSDSQDTSDDTKQMRDAFANEWDHCPLFSNCAGNFVQAKVCHWLDPKSLVMATKGVEHCCLIVIEHLEHSGAGQWRPRLPEALCSVFSRHVQVTCEALVTGEHHVGIDNLLVRLLLCSRLISSQIASNRNAHPAVSGDAQSASSDNVRAAADEIRRMVFFILLAMKPIIARSSNDLAAWKCLEDGIRKKDPTSLAALSSFVEWIVYPQREAPELTGIKNLYAGQEGNYSTLLSMLDSWRNSATNHDV